MALPTSYLTTTKNVKSIMTAMQAAEAPPKFNRKFLGDLGFKGSGDRLIINVLKALGFLSSDGSPTERYIRYLDQEDAPKVLAEGLREAYADLFSLKRDAQNMRQAELKSKIKTIRQGQGSDIVLRNMASTFLAFAGLADWKEDGTQKVKDDQKTEISEDDIPDGGPGLSIRGLTYAIHIQLPESRDPSVYDALFKSLKIHLLG